MGEAVDQGADPRPELAELRVMRGGQAGQHVPSLRGELDEDLPAVRTARLARDQSQGDQAVHQADRAVGAHLEPLGQVAHAQDAASLGAPDGQERLVLPGGEAHRGRRRLAEAEELAQGVPELGQGLVFRLADRPPRHS
jgi:hypothetical protein